MKKIGKKLSDFTKVFLVFGLLFSNLTSLKVVFAYEGEDDNTVINEQTGETTLDEEEEEKKEIEETDETLGEEENKEEEFLDEEEEEENKEEELEEDKEEELEEENLEETDLNEEETSEEPTESETVTHDYTKELNDSAKDLGLDGSYSFVEKDGKKILRVLVGVDDSAVLEIINNAFDDVTGEVVEDTVVLTAGEETIDYVVVVYDNDYLDKLMKVAVGTGEANTEDDLNGDGNVDAMDVALLKRILEDGFGSEIVKQSVSIESRFDGDVSNLSVGDTFTVQYVLTLSEYYVDGITGLINYNKDMLSLDNFEVRNFTTGADNDGKFLYFGDALRGTETVTTDDDGNELTTYSPKDYVVIVMTFTVQSAGSDTINIDDLGYFYGNLYYEGNNSDELDVTVLSSNNTLSSVTVGGSEIAIDELTDVYSITVPNDVTNVDLQYVLADSSASIYSIEAPEELAVGENTITITVIAENGEKRTYTINVTREEASEEEEKTDEEVVNPVNYQDDYTDNDDNKIEEDNDSEKIDTTGEEEKPEEKDESKLSRIIIIILILLAIAGLIYLIFRDEDDEETKKANKEVNKLRKEELKEAKTEKKVDKKKTNKKER